MDFPPSGVGPVPDPWVLSRQEIDDLFGTGRTHASFPCFEILLESEVLGLGHVPVHWSLDPEKSHLVQLETHSDDGEEKETMEAKLQRWKKLDANVLGPRRVRFACLVISRGVKGRAVIQSLEGRLRMPVDVAQASLRYIENLSVSVKQLERIRQFHLTLQWQVFGGINLIKPDLARFSIFSQNVPMEVLLLPLHVELPISPPLNTSTSLNTRSPTSSTSSRQASSPNTTPKATTTPNSSHQTCGPLSPIPSESLPKFVNWDIMDVFMKTRKDEFFDPAQHGAGSILRTSYGNSLFVLIETIPGDGLDTILEVLTKAAVTDTTLPAPMEAGLVESLSTLSLGSSSSSTTTTAAAASTSSSKKKTERKLTTVRQYLQETWNFDNLASTDYLLRAVPLIFKHKCAQNSLPTATKWLAPVMLTLKDCRDQATALLTESMQGQPSDQLSPKELKDLAEGFFNEREEKKLNRKLVPYLCQTLPLSLFDLNVASFMPIVLLSTRRRIKTLHFHQELSSFTLPGSTSPLKSMTSPSLPISQSNMLLLEEALTLPLVSTDFNYESLESLGDSVLKHLVSLYLFLTNPTSNEGDLTLRKVSKISNKFLANCKRARVIHRTCFHLEMSADMRAVQRPASLALKARADLCESVLGYFYTQYGEHGANVFLSWLSPEFETLISSALALLSNPTSYQLQFLSPPSHWQHDPQLAASILLPGQYQFKNPFLLATALTHSSSSLRPTGETYERLEFLGDAALDLLITSVVYDEARKEARPGLITQIRSQIACNASHACLSALSGLHLGLIYNAPSIYRDIITYLTKLQAHLTELNGQPGRTNPASLHDIAASPWIRNISYPEVLADVFEGVAGAILIDNGANFSTFAKLYLPLIRPIIRLLLEGGITAYGRRQPKVEYSELLQAKHCKYEGRIFWENGLLLLVWHNQIIAEVQPMHDSVLELSTLYQMAIQVLLNNAADIWSNCDCAPLVARTAPHHHHHHHHHRHLAMDDAPYGAASMPNRPTHYDPETSPPYASSPDAHSQSMSSYFAPPPSYHGASPSWPR